VTQARGQLPSWLVAVVVLGAARSALGQTPAPAAVQNEASGSSAPSPAESAAPEALQLAAMLGPTLAFGDAANPEYQSSVSRIGVALIGSLIYRPDYFLTPQLDIGYAALASGEARLPDGPWGTGGKVEQRLAEWIISPTVTADLWRFRPRLGLGLAIVSQANEFQGASHSVTQISLVTQFGLGFQVLETRALRIDAEARYVLAKGADIAFTTLGLAACFDVIQLGP
jgi:hypothetical protein